jgi:hypothetical protein
VVVRTSLLSVSDVHSVVRFGVFVRHLWGFCDVHRLFVSFSVEYLIKRVFLIHFLQDSGFQSSLQEHLRRHLVLELGKKNIVIYSMLPLH